MAIGRLSVKVGKPGKAGPHAAYIAREGRHANRPEKGERLEATEAGNLPAWAQANPLAFWQAADLHERANGTTYREFEVALPRELTLGERAALLREFVRQEIGDRHAYQFAIHCPSAADGKEQPHAHIMFSERQCDGIERDPEQYFKRHNSKAPEKGGSKKGWGEYAGQTRSKDERAADLKALRGRWETACNAALERVGHAERIDMRSHQACGLALPPERKLLPSEWRIPERKADVIEFRQARAELSRAVPDIAAEIINLEERRREAERPRGIERPGPAVASSRFKAKPEAAQSARREQRPGSIEAIAADLSKIDSTAPIEQQADAFMEVGNLLANWRSQKASHVGDRATERYRRRHEKLCVAQEARLKATPEGLLGVFKQKAYEAASAAYKRADALRGQAADLMRKIEDVARPETVKKWTWDKLAKAAPDLTERVKAHQAEAERQKREQAIARERERRQKQGQCRGRDANRGETARI